MAITPSDAGYREALSALENGTLPDEAMPALTGQLAARLRAAGVPEEFQAQCWDILAEYRIYVRERPDSMRHMTEIAAAAVNLADALAASGKSSHYKIIDDELFRRIISDTDSSAVMHRAISEDQWIGNASPNIGMERYLRAFAAMLGEVVEDIDHQYRWMGEVGAPQSDSKALRPFVVRRASAIVDLIGGKEWKTDMPTDWIPKERDCKDTRAPKGNNKIAVRLAEIILAESLPKNAVSKAFENRKQKTYGKRGENEKSA